MPLGTDAIIEAIVAREILERKRDTDMEQALALAHELVSAREGQRLTARSILDLLAEARERAWSSS